MPGHFAKDDLAVNLLADLDLTPADANAANGTAVQVAKPGLVQAILTLPATVAGTSLTATVEVQGASNSDFDEDVVSFGRFADIATTDDGDVRRFTFQCYSQYVRAVLTVSATGNDGDLTGATLYVGLVHDGLSDKGADTA